MKTKGGTGSVSDLSLGTASIDPKARAAEAQVAYAPRTAILCAALLFLTLSATAQVTYERIRHAEREPHNWLTYSGNYQSHRYSSLKQINTANVARLEPAWVYQMRDAGKVEASPLVVDGVIYLSEKPHVITALDGRTGRPLWTYRRTTASDARGCCGIPNRGLAILGDTLYHNTFDSHVIALNRHTGKVLWDVIAADYKLGYTMTAAPLALNGKIIVGVAGGEYGIRGFLDCYDAATGARLWRFWTIPAPREAGSETWPTNESWRTGGAPTWVTGSYDAELNLLYWTTGNPAPDWNGDERAGDNLYSDCLLALDADTGKLRWHFQFTPHDVWDWDANQTPVLFDAVLNGRSRKLIAQANRNAFYYVLDRVTGEFLRGTPYIKQTWASGLDARGRPLKLPNIEPSAEGTLLYPGLGGATNWYSPAYSPQTRWFYVLARENHPQYFFKATASYHAGDLFEGGGGRDLAGVEPYGVVKALDALTGTERWAFRLHAPAMAGLLATGGSLVFGGSSEGYFYALDARTGKALWQFMAGYQIVNNPISYAIRGRQYVATIAGQGLFVFALDDRGRSR